MLNVGVIGATGYTGEELIDILIRHTGVRLSYLAAKIDKPADISEIFPRFKKRIDLICGQLDIDLAISSCELLFLALPHTLSMSIAPRFLKAGKKVIDLSADYRLKDTNIYNQFYKIKHKDTENLNKAIYGLPEIQRAKIKEARLIANPGCYPTAAILGLAPLIACHDALPESIIIDAKTGVTGAGRRALLDYSFAELNQDLYAYKINIHQHMPEIEQELSKLAAKVIKTTFVPHLLPISRGILETIYVKQKSPARAGFRQRGEKIKNQKLTELYKKFYKKEPFIRIKNEDEDVRLKDVVCTNFCDISIKSFKESNMIIIVTAIDNLGKGAAGQAVQNMNIMCGFPEETGLI